VSISHQETLDEIKYNDPLIEINQRWSICDDAGFPYRVIRVLCRHPDDGKDGQRRWVCEEQPSHLGLKGIGVWDEYQIRRVFRPHV
jgi:hypothetical protein